MDAVTDDLRWKAAAGLLALVAGRMSSEATIGIRLLADEPTRANPTGGPTGRP